MATPIKLIVSTKENFANRPAVPANKKQSAEEYNTLQTAVSANYDRLILIWSTDILANATLVLGQFVWFTDDVLYRVSTSFNVGSPITWDDTKVTPVNTGSEHFKGVYADEAALDTAHPTAEPGDYALVDVGASEAALYIWDDTDSEWVASGVTTVVPDADESTKGIIEIADTSEMDAGSDDSKAVTPLKVFTKYNTRVNSLLTIRTEVASHTLDATDLANVNLGSKLMIRMNLTATAHNLTVPPNATQAFPIGAEIVVIQTGTGITTIVAGAGVTITPPAGGNLISPGQGQPMVLVKTGTNTWDLYNGNEAQALTKVDDTNVTLTFGGAPTSSLLSAVSLTLGWTGALATGRGGLGTTAPEGSYTPTLTGVANVAASTAFLTSWYRIGSTVTVFGKVNIDVTAAAPTLTELGISLPIASALAAEEDVAGIAVSDAAASLSARIKADVANARASLIFRATSLTNDSYSFKFTYLIK